jgi:hypothetical protein
MYTSSVLVYKQTRLWTMATGSTNRAHDGGGLVAQINLRIGGSKAQLADCRSPSHVRLPSLLRYLMFCLCVYNFASCYRTYVPRYSDRLHVNGKQRPKSLGD